MKSDGGKMAKIKQINIELFGGCNLSCPMCPQSNNGRERDFKKYLSFNLFKKIVDEAIPHGLEFVSIAGSGEPLLAKNLVECISYLTEHGIKSLIYTNGIRLDERLFRDLCSNGLSDLKVSCQGWDKESYAKWMSIDAYDEMREKLMMCYSILNSEKKYDTFLQTNHLIQDYDESEYQKSMYMKNWIDYLNCFGEIWMGHNWAGQYVNDNISRVSKGLKEKSSEIKLRSCGRPLSNVIEIRAGGLNGHKAAVVPCPNVLGRDSDAVLGHADVENVFDVFNGVKYRNLRKAHISKNFKSIDYCKDCDHLIDYPDALVWTNVPGRVYGESRISNIAYV